jgi:uncharacterized membrane protein (UPF0127 family)
MKDTLVPLDILYLEDDGSVIAVRTMQPPATGVPDHDLPRFHSPKDCRLVLEVAAGMAAAHRIAPGSRIGLPDSVPRLIRESGP